MLGRCFLVLLFASLLAACFTLTAQESKRSGPETTVADRPADVTAKTSAVFRFSGGEGTVTFKCKLDGEEWKNCNSPLYLNKLKEGTHKLSVAAVDKDGNADSTPAVVSWKIDATPPVSKIQSAPKKVTGKKCLFQLFSKREVDFQVQNRRRRVESVQFPVFRFRFGGRGAHILPFRCGFGSQSGKAGEDLQVDGGSHSTGIFYRQGTGTAFKQQIRRVRILFKGEGR